TGFLDTNVVQTQRPAETKIADALVAAVVSARDFHGHAGHRNAQVGERDSEVAYLQVALDNNADCRARDLAETVRRRQSEVEQAVQHHGGIEGAQRAAGRAVAAGNRRPDAIVRIVIAIQTVLDRPRAAAD